MWRVLFALLLVACSPAISCTGGQEQDHSDFYRITMEIKDAVLREDVDYLMKYVAPSGTYFIDAHYTYEEIRELLQGKESWLYKFLFEDEDSVKKYFEDVPDLEIEIMPYGPAEAGYKSVSFLYWLRSKVHSWKKWNN